MRAIRSLLPLLMVLAGCGGKADPTVETPYDEGRARVALLAALDAWKKDEVKGLARRVPPIRFVDDDVMGGMRLAEYEIEEPDAPLTQHQDVNVILMLRDERGRKIRREARYQVATVPSLAVLRNDR